ncbi:MAG: 4-hydroxy-tetrahydrodipicolinate synthase [Candidatus Hydrogenedentota bacterium]
MIYGSVVALVTPFKNDGSVDYKKIKELVEFHIEKGSDWILPCGTTGESATLSHEEHKNIIKTVVDASAGRIPVIAGCGSNNTKESIELICFATQAGAEACLVITPYYNKPTQEGLYQHFKAISDSTHLPIILYNVPGRTGVNLEPATIEKLNKIGNIVGVKEASGNMQQIEEIILRTRDDFVVLSGDDALTLPILAVGGKGVVSVTANILPSKVAQLVDSFFDDKWEQALLIHEYLFDISKAMFLETNPIPVKTAMSMMELIEDNLRLPLVKMSQSNKERLEKILKEKGVI